MRKRRTHPPEFKAQVALDALSSQKTLAEVAASHQLHPVQVCQWKKQAAKRLPELFRSVDCGAGQDDAEALSLKLAKLERANAALTQELEWLKKKFYSYDQLILRSLLEPAHPSISLRRQCELLGATRSSYYYHPVNIGQKNKDIALLIDQLCRDDPSISSRNLLAQLHRHGFVVCKNYLYRLLCRLGFAPFERKMARLLANRLLQAPPLPWRQEELGNEGEQWILDIAYWPAPRLDLFAALLVDACSRNCLAWGLSNRLSADLPKAVLQLAMDSSPVPFLLCCETFLPYLSHDCLQGLQHAGIGCVGPSWLDPQEGSGRATVLAPLWRWLKQEAAIVRSDQTQLNEEWVLQRVIAQYQARVDRRESCGKDWLLQGANSLL